MSDDLLALAFAYAECPPADGEVPGMKDARRFAAALLRLHAVLAMVPAYTKHGPAGTGREGPCDATCIKCRVEDTLRKLKEVP